MTESKSRVGMPAAFARAAALVEGWLTGVGHRRPPLTTNDLAVYPGRSFVAGWRLDVRFSDKSRRLDLLLPVGFPW